MQNNKVSCVDREKNHALALIRFKTCNICGESRNTQSFYFRKYASGNVGLEGRCMSCMNKKRLELYYKKRMTLKGKHPQLYVIKKDKNQNVPQDFFDLTNKMRIKTEKDFILVAHSYLTNLILTLRQAIQDKKRLQDDEIFKHFWLDLKQLEQLVNYFGIHKISL